MRSALRGFLGLAVVCITLTLGLWPFHAPRNDVTWLTGTNGLAFGKHGTVLGSGLLGEHNLQDDKGRAIEIRVLPARRNSATLLALYSPESATRFALRQSLSDLELLAEANGSRKAIYVDKAFDLSLHQKKPVDITVSSGPAGTRVYIDGLLARVLSQFQIPAGSFTGRLVVGDSPAQPDSFRERSAAWQSTGWNSTTPKPCGSTRHGRPRDDPKSFRRIAIRRFFCSMNMRDVRFVIRLWRTAIFIFP